MDFEDKLTASIVGLFILLLVSLIGFGLFTKWEATEQNVSGIVYSTNNNTPISGATTFKVRASVDTYIDKDTNESAYCVPTNSQYKEIINKAAADKNIKVQVTTKKGFWVKAPWTCIDNVIVTEIK